VNVVKNEAYRDDNANGTFYQSTANARQESLAIAKMTARCALYKLFTLILFTLTATVLCTDFDSERI